MGMVVLSMLLYTIGHSSKRKKRVKYMIRYEDGEMVLPDHLEAAGEKIDNTSNQELIEEEELDGGGGDEVDSVNGEESGDSDGDGDPAEQYGSDLESDPDIEEDTSDANNHKQVYVYTFEP